MQDGIQAEQSEANSAPTPAEPTIAGTPTIGDDADTFQQDAEALTEFMNHFGVSVTDLDLFEDAAGVLYATVEGASEYRRLVPAEDGGVISDVVQESDVDADLNPVETVDADNDLSSTLGGRSLVGD